MKLRAIGIDPGPTPGIVELRYEEGVLVEIGVVQCSASVFPAVLQAVLYIDGGYPRTLVQVEQYVTSGNNKDAAAARQTRAMVDEALSIASRVLPSHRSVVTTRNAGQTKPWATDQRLQSAQANGQSLMAATKGMTHARDAARHALFIAVDAGQVPDPLSKTNQKRSTTP